MDITEEKLNELFGVTPEADNSGNTQEVADPAANTEDSNQNEGANDQEPAEPETEAEGTEANEEDSEAEGEPNKQQTADERRNNAARRRKQEEQDRINAAVSKALAEERARKSEEMKDFFSRAGLKNSITGEPIRDIEEFNSWNKQYNQAKLEKDLAEGKVTSEDLNKIIESSPQMQEARQKAQQYEQRMQQDMAARAKKAMEAEIAIVHELDPSINTVDDFKKMPNYAEFAELVSKGCTFDQAYKAVNFSRAADTRAAAAKQAAMNNQRGKDHLTGTGSARGNGDKNVPAEEMRMFRLFNPNASEAEIREYYNRMIQQKG